MEGQMRKNFKQSKPNQPDFEMKEFEGSLPTNEKVENKSLTYNVKAFRDLQNVGAIEVKADPNASILRGSYPYNIIARTNRVVDANYAGKPNIEGNILTRLQNSNKSQLLNIFDVATINFRANYLYLCYSRNETTKHNNLAVNMEMNKAFNEALSKGYSTMFTQLPYYTDTIVTSLPVPSTYSAAETNIYHKLGGLLHYQTVLQNAMLPISKYIQTLSLQQECLNMSYRREAPTVTALYGLLMKKAFKATLNAIGTNIIGEYFDLNWYKQMNTLANIASRKSNSMTDPLMTATMTTCIPTCTMSTAGQSPVTYYNSANVLKASGIWLNPDTWTFDGTSSQPADLSFEQLIYRLCRMLDISTILTWARKLNTNSADVGSIQTPSAYYQQIVKLIEAINLILTKFSTSMSEIRTFIDKLNESHFIYWKKGVSLSVEGIRDYPPVYNIILHNLIANYIGGSSTMIFDTNTQRWQCSTMWNKYTGIPSFDQISGGAFLTFGLRKLDTGSLLESDTAMCLPIMFADELLVGSSKCVITNRKGLLLQVVGSEVTSVVDDPTLARLDPLEVGFKVKIPTVNITDIAGSASEKAKISSAIQSLLLNIAGYGRVYTSSTVYRSALDPDYICFLDLQIADVSNEMIQFCRNYSPFRVMTPDGERTMGFGRK
jgi:hypothetical protein